MLIFKVRKEKAAGSFHSNIKTKITHQKAIKLVVNDKMRSRLTDSNGNISIGNQIIAGATAGACQCVVTSPMEMFKIAGQTGIPLKTIWNER